VQGCRPLLLQQQWAAKGPLAKLPRLADRLASASAPDCQAFAALDWRGAACTGAVLAGNGPG